MASLKLDYVQPQDIPAIAFIDREAFYPGEHPYIETMHPNAYTPEGLQNKIQQWRGRYSGLLPNEHWLKVTDTTTNTIILTGTWLSPCKDEENLNNVVKDPVVQGPYWKTENDLAWAQHLSTRYTQRRRNAFRHNQGRLFAIMHLGVHPDHQNKGAGALFMKWGTEQADRLGLECVVEASIRAEGYYKKWGFEAREHVRFEVPERWSGKGVQEYVWMVRVSQVGISL